MKVFRYLLTLIVLMFLQAQLFAAKPRLITHNSLADFEKGKANGISILHGGKLALAPQTKLLLDTGDPFVWNVVQDSKGSIYLATGNDGRIYKTNVDGDSTLFFDAKELEVFALEIDSKNNIYAATFPNGKVYKISPTGKDEIFFDPDDSYIWDLEFDKKGNLLVATGQNAKIYQVTKKGEATELLASEQKHIRCLTVGEDGTIYAGSSGNGYIYKLEDGKNPFVLYDTQMAEVHNIAITENGAKIYAAAFGSAGFTPPLPQAQPAGKAQKSENASKTGGNPSEVSLSPQAIIPENIRAASGTRTKLFRLDKNGYAKDIWMDINQQVMQLATTANNELLVGTGKEGNVYKVAANGEISLLLSMEESQITAFSLSKKGSVIAGTSNMGRAYIVENSTADKASFESQAIDAGTISQWGVLSWEGTMSDANVAFFTRTGNTEQPGNTWSEWVPVVGNRVQNPMSRFLQWKCELGENTTKSEYVDKVSVSYLQKNLEPEITAVIIHKPGDYFSPDQSANSGSLNGNGLVFPQSLGKSESKKGFRSVDWMFEDPNFDGLVFDVYFKKVGKTFWKELAKDLKASVYSWDSSLMEDGEYLVKVVAKDSPANPDNLALQNEKLSDPFKIDNTGPSVKSKVSKNNVNVTVSDEWNLLKTFEYSFNAQDYKEIYPKDGITDSKKETFEIKIPAGAKEAQLTIRVRDALDNITVKHISVN